MFGQGFGGCVGAHSGTLGKALTGSSVSPSGSHPLLPKPPRPDDSRKPLVCFHNAPSRQILQGPMCLFWSLSRKAKSKENAQVWGQRLSPDISCMTSAMCQELVQLGSKRCPGKTRPRILIRAMSHISPVVDTTHIPQSHPLAGHWPSRLKTTSLSLLCSYMWSHDHVLPSGGQKEGVQDNF